MTTDPTSPRAFINAVLATTQIVRNHVGEANAKAIIADLDELAQLRAQRDAVVGILARRARAAHDSFAVAMESDGEAAELAEARGRWLAQCETRDQVRRELDLP